MPIMNEVYAQTQVIINLAPQPTRTYVHVASAHILDYVSAVSNDIKKPTTFLLFWSTSLLNDVYSLGYIFYVIWNFFSFESKSALQSGILLILP